VIWLAWWLLLALGFGLLVYEALRPLAAALTILGS
jgi:membrane-bound ClpP family serine protease